jgi:hypothetical protein
MPRFLGLSALAVLLLTASPASAQLRSELSLGGYTVSITYAPDVRVNDARVRLGQLETNASLRLGEAEIGKRDPAGTRYDVSLERTSGGWDLLLGAADAAGQSIRVPLRVASDAGPTNEFVAALIPETSSTGRLRLRWGSTEAAAAFAFIDPPRVRRTAETTQPNTTVNRTHDEDTSALSRARLLAQRNETVMVLAKGQRLSVSFQRSFGSEDRPADGGGVRTRGLPVDGPDFARLSSTADRSVVMLTQSAVPRLTVEAPLRFGKTLVRTGNQVRGFPGSYGIWLKRAGSSWRLVFNDEPDAWGSQHDPKFDAGEIELTHAEGPGGPGDNIATRPFAVGLVPTGADRGRLLIIWGPHEWSADFVVGS